MTKTGWPAPPLMQDDNPQLSRWFATRPDARYVFKRNQRREKMKVWKTTIDVYVTGDTEQEAIDNVIGELDYAFSHLDTPLHAYSHPESAQLESETED